MIFCYTAVKKFVKCNRKEEDMDPFKAFSKFAMAILIGIGLLILFGIIITAFKGNAFSIMCLLWIVILFALIKK
jgi:hypothetical protein